MLEAVSLFVAKVATRLNGIAFATRSGLKGPELHGEVWLAAADLSQRRGRDIDFANHADQELVLSRVYTELRRQQDGRLHFAACLDEECDDGLRLGERVAGLESHDPAVALEQREIAMEQDEKLANSYSQAAAYIVVCSQFQNDRRRISAHLAILSSTLAARIDRAIAIYHAQSSLFDGIHVTTAQFVPMPGRRYVDLTSQHLKAEQCAWEF
jgi:hypothetical protein